MTYATCQRRDDGVAVITMDREERLNALGVELVSDTVDALHQAEADPEVRAAVLTGAGRAFSSGGDLADVGARVADGEPGSRLDVMRALHRLIVGLRDSRLPIVADVHGPAYGAGFSTALACDLIVASEDARFCQVFVRRNLVPDLGSPWLLPRAVGHHVAKELMLLGEEISATEAHRLGIVNRLAATPAEAHELALKLAAKMATTLPATMAMSKGLVNRSQALTLEDSLRLEEHAQAMALGTPETLGAMRAFLAKAAH
jgi:2-(1,2-epoxy-1,2-dihydrophenyl)acetyl-CoA isomerase